MKIVTQWLSAEAPGALAHAGVLLRQGELVVFPTDTVYGVGADAFSAAALDRLYQAKQRPLSKGVPILISDAEQVARIAAPLPEHQRPIVQTLMAAYWPGPLTLILPRSDALPANLSPNAGVAVRLPANDFARAIIRQAGGAVATSSANLSGAEPACTAAEAFAALQGVVAAVIDGGPTPGGVPSTIVDCTGAVPHLVRAGPIPFEQLLEALKPSL